jgi:hypothetical protein
MIKNNPINKSTNKQSLASQSPGKQIKGVTIVELLVYMGLLMIFLAVLLDIFVAILNAKLESQSTSAISSDTRYILSQLAYGVNNADNITTPSSWGVAGNTLTVSKSGVADTYSLDPSGNLNVTRGGVVMKLNGNDTTLTDISFTKIGNPSVSGNKPTVKVLFTIKSLITVHSGNQTQTVQTAIGIR